jgi:quercetin dioxygenase-like cupin family protein
MIFALHEHPGGIETAPGNRIVYDVARNAAHAGAASVEGHALVWELSEQGGEGAALAVDVSIDPRAPWVMRCDRVDFPPGGIAYRHVHPGPGIRRLLHGALRIEAEGTSHVYQPGEPWFEGAEHPVLATAAGEDTAFVRVLLLPAEWAGKRTIRYLDPADEEKPKLQRATIFLEEAIAP